MSSTNLNNYLHKTFDEICEVDRIINNSNKALNPIYESPLDDAIMKKPKRKTLTVEEIIQIARDEVTARDKGTVSNASIISCRRQNNEILYSELKKDLD